MNDDIPRLACGRPVDEVWESIDLPLTAHEEDCQDCRNARASLSALRSATDEMRTGDEADTSLRLGSTIKSNVMALARAEISRSRRLPMTSSADDAVRAELSISEHAIAGVIRRAADEFPQVRARRCRVVSASSPNGDPTALREPQTGAPLPIEIGLRIAVRADAAIADLQDQVRQRVARTVSTEVGLPVQRVDLVVEDVFDD